MNEVRGKPALAINVIGAGGIGSWLIHGLVRPARKFAHVSGAHLTIRVYDSDKVERDNVHHQNFKPADVGKSKAKAICEELVDFTGNFLVLVPCEWDVRGEEDFEEAELTVVAVDSPQARELIVGSTKAGKWAICTCAGDSFMFLTEEASDQAISMVTQKSQGAASCQLPGAISEGKVEAGSMAVATLAATWILRSLRGMSGDSGAKPPTPRAGSTVLGTLGSMERATEEGGL